MSTLYLRRLRMSHPITAYRKSLSIAANDGIPRSHIKVERKFLPTEELRSEMLSSNSMKFLNDIMRETTRRYDVWGDGSGPLFNVLRLPDLFLRDAHYDLNDQLSAKGIWIRRRNSHPIAYHPIVGLSRRTITETSNGTLEAKFRLQGDFTNSQFQEIKGESRVATLLENHVPGVKLRELKELVKLGTYRKIWKVIDSRAEMHIVFDDSSEGRTRFLHEIGEVEITKEVVGGTNELEHGEMRRKAAEQMDVFIEAFINRHPELFVVSPKPKGKLSAYLEWKKFEAERRGKKEGQQGKLSKQKSP